MWRSKDWRCFSCHAVRAQLKIMGEIMKKVLIISFFILTSAGCQEDVTNTDDNFSFVMEDHSNHQYQFPAGVYYEYTFEDWNSYSFNEVNILKDIRNSGIEMNDAWFKHYRSSCAPPGSNIAMQVIVPAELIIRVNRSDIRLNSFGFTKISNPNISHCAYIVKHYTFK